MNNEKGSVLEEMV